MTVTPEKRAELRAEAEQRHLCGHPLYPAVVVLSLLDALDSAQSELATLRAGGEASALEVAPSVWLLSPVEFPKPLEPGDRITSDDHLVYEVRKLRCKSSPIAGEPRDLFIALHDGPGSAIVFFRLDGGQQEWALRAKAGR